MWSMGIYASMAIAAFCGLVYAEPVTNAIKVNTAPTGAIAAEARSAIFSCHTSPGFGYAPADYQQGDSFRIIYIHVPAAMWSMGIYARHGEPGYQPTRPLIEPLGFPQLM
jgi:hypothetical protein